MSSAAGVFAQAGANGITSVKMKPHNMFVTESASTGMSLNFQNTHAYKKSIMMQNFGGNLRGGRALGFDTLGTAGNLLTIIDGSVNSLAANQTINSVVFIHRADPTVDPNANVAQYKYDLSTDGGNSFTNDYGVLNPSCENFDTAGRYPNVAFHIPSGSTTPATSYIAYLGTWLPYQGGSGRTWEGTVTGVARLDNDSTTFTEAIRRPNNGDVGVSGSLVNGQPGEFWAVDFSTVPGDSAAINDVIVHKGVFNTSTNDVDWTFSLLNVPFVVQATGGAPAASVGIAFDPTGNNGWIYILGDITADSDSTLNPIFYQTTDGGDNWTGPVQIRLSDLPNVVAGLTVDSIATTAFDADLVVDVNGNPHLLVVIGSSGGTGYSIATAAAGGGSAGLKIYDLTYNPNGSIACQWQAIYLDDVQTFRGDLATATGGFITEDNRPQASRSEDGNLLFFGWCDSDPTQVTDNANDLPNFKGLMFNIATNKASLVVDFTIQDATFSGSAMFATVSPTLFVSGNNYTVPTVFAQPNVNTGSSEDPASFFYIKDIKFTSTDLVANLGADIPVITLLGENPEYVYLSENFNDPGASADDCNDGDLTSSIIVNSSALNTNARGTYNVDYEVTDSDNNTASVTRQVIVNTEPDSRFGYTLPSGTSVQFRDSSLYTPTSWQWNFGDGSGSTLKNPTKTYAAAGTYTVCLKARNNYNSAPFNKPADEECKTISVTGIEEKLSENAISVYPNPTNSVVTVEVATADYNNATLEIFNLVGERIISNDVTLVNNKQNIIKIDLSGNANGIYLVKFNTDKGSISKRVSLMK